MNTIQTHPATQMDKQSATLIGSQTANPRNSPAPALSLSAEMESAALLAVSSVHQLAAFLEGTWRIDSVACPTMLPQYPAGIAPGHAFPVHFEIPQLSGAGHLYVRGRVYNMTVVSVDFHKGQGPHSTPVGTLQKCRLEFASRTPPLNGVALLDALLRQVIVNLVEIRCCGQTDCAYLTDGSAIVRLRRDPRAQSTGHCTSDPMTTTTRLLANIGHSYLGAPAPFVPCNDAWSFTPTA